MLRTLGPLPPLGLLDVFPACAVPVIVASLRPASMAPPLALRDQSAPAAAYLEPLAGTIINVLLTLSSLTVLSAFLSTYIPDAAGPAMFHSHGHAMKPGNSWASSRGRD